MNKGGVFGGYIACKFEGGTSWKYQKDQKGDSAETVKKNKDEKGTNKSKIAFIKEPIAKFFGIAIPTKAELNELSVQTKTLTINGVTHQSKSVVRQGATGRSRSVTVKFKFLQNIGGKKVASVKLAMPSSYTMADMLRFLQNSSRSNVIAAIVSDKGNSWTYGTAYNPKKKAAAGK